MTLQPTATDAVCLITIISYRSITDYDYRITCVFIQIQNIIITFPYPRIKVLKKRSQAQSNFLFVPSSFQLITRWQHTLILVLINRALMKNLERLFACPIYKNQNVSYNHDVHIYLSVRCIIFSSTKCRYKESIYCFT